MKYINVDAFNDHEVAGRSGVPFDREGRKMFEVKMS